MKNLFLVKTDMTFISKEVDIDESIEISEFVNRIFKKMKDTHQLDMFCFKNDEYIFYWNYHNESYSKYYWHLEDHIADFWNNSTPSFINMILNNAPSGVMYKPTGVENYIENVKSFLPIKTKLNALKFIDWFSGGFNVTYNPTINIKDYGIKSLTNIECIWLNHLNDISIDLLGDDIYNIDFKTLTNRGDLGMSFKYLNNPKMSFITLNESKSQQKTSQKTSQKTNQKPNQKFTDYEDFFNSKLQEFKVKSPSQLNTKDKKKFFNELSNWKSLDESLHQSQSMLFSSQGNNSCVEDEDDLYYDENDLDECDEYDVMGMGVNLNQKESSYNKKFKEKLQQYGVKSPAQLSDSDKKKFFNEVKKL